MSEITATAVKELRDIGSNLKERVSGGHEKRMNGGDGPGEPRFGHGGRR